MKLFHLRVDSALPCEKFLFEPKASFTQASKLPATEPFVYMYKWYIRIDAVTSRWLVAKVGRVQLRVVMLDLHSSLRHV